MKKNKSILSKEPGERLLPVSARISNQLLDKAKYYPGNKSEFIREALYHYKDNRHKFKFRELLEALAGEILILSKWQELGHPAGAKWTEALDQQLEYYETCFDVLENSPFNQKQS
jgi:thymidine phosphorylase